MKGKSSREKLRELRINAKETQADVAKAIDVSESAYNSYETGARVPRDPVKVKIAKHFDRTVQYIFFGDDAQ